MGWWWPKARLAKLARSRGRSNLEQLRGKGRAAVLNVAAFSPPGTGRCAASASKATIDGMYRASQAAFDLCATHGREGNNADAVAMSVKDVRAMFKSLRPDEHLVRTP